MNSLLETMPISARITPLMKADLKETARRVGVPVSDLIRVGITLAINMVGRDLQGQPTDDPARGRDLVDMNYTAMIQAQSAYDLEHSPSRFFRNKVSIKK